MRSERSHHGHPPSQGAFSLGEVLVAILCLAVLMLPLLAYVTGIAGLGNRVAEESGTRAWQSVQGTAVTEGVDSSAAGLLLKESNPGVSQWGRQSVSSEAAQALPGRVSIGVIRLPGFGERQGAAGFQLLAGQRLPEPEVPAQALLPRSMEAPVVNPVPGSVVPVGAFSAAGTIPVVARSLQGGRVCLRLELPLARQEGVGEASLEVSAAMLASGLRGEAWVEFDGASVPGAIRVALADGRAEWHVPESGGERLISPSSLVTVNYRLGLGAPVLQLGSTEYVSGAEVSVDYPLLMSIQSGGHPFGVTWPAAVRTMPGLLAAIGTQGFETQFQGNPGPLDGGLAGFAREALLGVWENASRVDALPLVGANCRVEPGSWRLRKDLLQLPVPEATLGLSAPLSGGLLGFRAAVFGELGRLGRLSARGGAVLSAGGELELEVLP